MPNTRILSLPAHDHATASREQLLRRGDQVVAGGAPVRRLQLHAQELAAVTDRDDALRADPGERAEHEFARVAPQPDAPLDQRELQRGIYAARPRRRGRSAC